MVMVMVMVMVVTTAVASRQAGARPRLQARRVWVATRAVRRAKGRRAAVSSASWPAVRKQCQRLGEVIFSYRLSGSITQSYVSLTLTSPQSKHC